MKVADYVIDAIADVGVKDFFVVYGAANGDLIDAFTRTDKTRYVAVMHEQAGGFAAEAYAKTTGGLGAAIATSGPGGQNFVTPMGNCFYDSVPCIFITGQINSRFLRPNESIRQIGFQETDIVKICEPVTKYAVMITDAKDIRYEVEKCIHEAMSGRPGPVLLDIPLNIQKQEINPDELIGFHPAPTDYRNNTVDAQIQKLVEDIRNAERPCFLIGGGAKNVAGLNRMLEIAKIPAFPTWNALHLVTDDNPMFGGRIGTYGGKGRNFGIQNSDLIIGVGTRLSGRITGGNIHSFGREAKRYTVDLDKPALQPHLQQVPFHENIFCDSEFFMDQLADRLEFGMQPDFSDWIARVMDWKIKYDPVKPEYFEQNDPMHQYAFMRTLSNMCDSKDVILGDCGGNIVTMAHAFETKSGQTWITNNGNSPMGFSFAAGMGAVLANQQQSQQGNVVCIIGDGGMNMNIQELQTLVNYNMPLKTFILNNQIYGITKAYQETNFEGRSEACGPKGYSPPDFVKIANAYGIQTFEIDRNFGQEWEHIEQKIQEVLDYPGPAVCNVDVFEEHTYEPKIIGWETPIEDMYPYLPEQEMKENMIIEQLGVDRFYPSVEK